MTVQTATARAKGRDLVHKRGDVHVSMRLTREQHEALKAHAVKNCRTMAGECLFRVLQGLRAEGP